MNGELESCAWCFDQATATVLVQVTPRGDEHEVDFCDRHIEELLTGARPAHRAPTAPERR